MTLLAATGLGLLIGAVLGALGGGGAILTVPALVYLLGQEPRDATTSSVIIVGLTAVVGAVGHARSGHVRWRTGLPFGVTGFTAAIAGTAANQYVEPHILLLGFAALMTIAAIGMLAHAHHATSLHDTFGDGLATGSTARTGAAQLTRPEPARSGTGIAVKVAVVGLLVGFLTGLFGAGGGFVIVPALVLVLGLPMPTAVGTSLLIIAINSAASLATRAGHAHFEWPIILPFTIAAMAASLAGKKIADRLPGTVSTRAFAVLILAVAAYTAARTLLGR
ncbi:sulfite exporter TauE/SafE family protein [Salinispora arenicola]|uniref:sulfite exporter TauE/SafE family protein n=1 Tax=Salinispora arenicola TaxID=168697 RepID=UPI000361179E|nr:sulfite exporter TauE/SafE family protein [Salinispora arenicola]